MLLVCLTLLLAKISDLYKRDTFTRNFYKDGNNKIFKEKISTIQFSFMIKHFWFFQWQSNKTNFFQIVKLRVDIKVQIIRDIVKYSLSAKDLSLIFSYNKISWILQ